MDNEKQLNIAFINTGSDDAIIKSMANDNEHQYDNDELSKAIDKAKLVQKEVQVKDKNGQTFTRKQWVKAGEDVKQPNQAAAKPDESKTPSRISAKNASELIDKIKEYGFEMDFADQYDLEHASKPNQEQYLHKDGKEYFAYFTRYSNGNCEFYSIKPTGKDSNLDTGKDSNDTVDSNEDTDSTSFEVPKDKAGLAKLLQSGISRDEIMTQAEKSGITWKKSDHAGINWMRAAMAMTGTSTKGNKDSKKSEKSDESNKSNKTKDDSGKDEVDSKQEKSDIVDAEGNLTPPDGMDLHDLVEDISGMDMFDIRDSAHPAIQSYIENQFGEYDDYFVETMGIKNVKVKGDSLIVTADVTGYCENGDYEDNFNTMVSFKVPISDRSKLTKNQPEESKEDNTVNSKYVDKDGNLVATKDMDISDIVEELSNMDMFDVRDSANTAIQSYLENKLGEYDDYFIETMGIEKGKVSGNNIIVTAQVSGYYEDGGGEEPFDTVVSFKVPLANKDN